MTMEILAIDLGKQSFHLHGIDADGVVISRKVSRAKLENAVTELDPAIIHEIKLRITCTFFKLYSTL